MTRNEFHFIITPPEPEMAAFCGLLFFFAQKLTIYCYNTMR